MADPIYIDIEIVEPILLEIDTEPIYYVGTAAAGPQGIQGVQGETGPGWSPTEGAKSSSTDAGTFGDISITDDYIYFCVQTGEAGSAIWKKSVVFQT